MLPLVPLPPDVERCLRRSRVRLQVLRALGRVGSAYASQLARHAEVDVRRVHLALHGGLPCYRPELALVRLGLVGIARTRDGTSYRLTSRGRVLLDALGAGATARSLGQ